MASTASSKESMSSLLMALRRCGRFSRSTVTPSAGYSVWTAGSAFSPAGSALSSVLDIGQLLERGDQASPPLGLGPVGRIQRDPVDDVAVALRDGHRQLVHRAADRED